MSWARSDVRRRLLVAALVAYALVVAVTPFLHHDLACHERTPGHCVACVASPAALGALAVAPSTSPALTDVGAVEPPATAIADFAFTADSHGRSPPL